MNATPDDRRRPEHPTLSHPFLEGVKQNDPAQWSRLVETFGPIVYRWCRTSGVAESDAADVVQDIFASLARGISGFERQKESGSFRSWLATITRNRVRDHFRRLADRQPAEGGTEALTRLQQQADSLDQSIDGDSIHSPLVRQVLKSVEAEFEPTTWDAFWLTTIESQPASLVAETTGLSVASVYQSKSRVLRKLRRRLSELP
ncbi:RNA polymerase sigma factor RpoE [Stieleria maiorica]|uniref:RNA polymerase sigma factor RpoE n=1 Tax=Stieleria maiorica TaxID=2795974 RepID=A0A5B9MME7_9BACT|nr:sigma-70 family RNA polymerase sigma factor [Stieleria maiorica]QEG02539.1 RNA polymerase sigma factor RpoE [Stieleria maiorica]